MIQEIKYNGITTNPSDYQAPDGDLALCSNLINEDGRLQPLPQPSPVLSLSDGLKVIYIHRTPAIKHYIIANSDNSALSWKSDIPDSGITEFWQASPDVSALNLAAIGNTLILTATDGLHYFLWKTDGNNPRYLYLGQQPPELQLQFGVSANNFAAVEPIDGIIYSEGFKWFFKSTHFDVSTIMDETFVDTILPEYRKSVTDFVWSLINPVNAKITETNHFYAPFFVRYCYRLYDEKTIMHSAPVFLPLNVPKTFHLGCSLSSEDDACDLYLAYKPVAVSLLYRCLNPDSLANWSDIVASVDVFASLPFIREDSSKNIEMIQHSSTHIKYTDNNLYIDSTGSYSYSPVLPLLYDEDEFLDKIKSVGAFYKIASLDVAEGAASFPSNFTSLKIPTGVLSSLATQEAMTDDYKTHNSLIPANGCTPSSFIYNRRLNLAGFAEKLFDGFCINSLLPYVTPPSSNSPKIYAIAVVINSEEGEKTVVHSHPDGADFSPLLLIKNPLFYPDNRATRMDIYWVNDNNSLRTSLPMKPCPLLNGAFTQGGLITSINEEPPYTSDSAVPTPDNTVNVAHKIYTSEVNNPFFFPVTGINTVGSGIVLGLAAATKALSEGQFGQFPLYAFTSEGIWALSVNSSGGYSASNPIPRDVCINPLSITPIDNAVLFASSRGIMLLQGPSSVCISDSIKDSQQNLPSIVSILSIDSIPSVIPFHDFIDNARMAYDYTHQRVLLFNPSCNYAYIYSLKSRLWGMAPSNLLSVVNDYPDTLAMTSEGTLVSLSHPQTLDSKGDPVAIPAFYITRPIKLSPPNSLKTVLSLSQHGLFQRGDVKTLLYGSRDLFNWHLIASSSSHQLHNLHGTPYKFFRIVTIAYLSPDKSLDGVSFEFKPRHANTLQ